MKDFNNKDITVGASALVCEGHGRNAGASFSKAKVVSLTARMVRLKPLSYSEDNPYSYLKSPEKVFITEDLV